MRFFLIGASVIVLVVFAILFYNYEQRRLAKSRLTAVYEEGLKPVKSKGDVFCPEAQLAYYDSLGRLSSNTPRQSFSSKYFQADALIKLGDEKKAIDLLTDIVEKLKANPGQAPDKDPRRSLALAWLRLGERNNCIMHHGMESCIFPIQSNGVYTDLSASEKGIALYQQLLKEDSTDLESRWLVNIAYMTIGEYPGKVPPGLLIPGLGLDSASSKINAFVDKAGSLHLSDHKNMAGGMIVDDFNNDGYLDIITSEWGMETGMHYYRNNCNGSFTDLSLSSGLSRIKGSLNIMQVDYNNDGLTDIFVLRGGWKGKYGRQPKTLLRNNGDGTFTDVTVESGLVSLHPTQAAVWADFNNDGWPDVFIGHETMSIDDVHPCELWINNQDGTFTEVAKAAGCALTGFVKGVTSADYNNDSWADIFVSQRDGHKVLLKNKAMHSKIPQFEDVTHQAGLDKDTTFTFPTWFWDYDNDGWPDIFVCGYKFNGSLAKAQAAEALHLPMPSASTMYLYRNNHDGTFTNVTHEVGLDHPVFAMGSNFGDIDNDGWLDMYLGTGNPDFESLTPNKLYRNIGGKKFEDITTQARVGNLQKGHAVAFADVDNDGDQDIFIETGGAYEGDAYYNSFYVNPGQNDNHWISITLEGTKSCRSALGARIAVRFTENGRQRTVYRDVNSGGSFGSSPLRKEIGIGSAVRVDELVITWPMSGIIQTFRNLAPGQFLDIREGDNTIKKINLKVLHFTATDMSGMTILDCPPPVRR